MLELLMQIFLSKIGIGFGFIMFVASACILYYLRFPRWAISAALILGVVHIYSGTIYQTALSNCLTKVEREIKKETERRIEVARTTLALSKQRIDVLERQMELARKQSADLASKLSQAPLECVATEGDIDEITR